MKENKIDEAAKFYASRKFSLSEATHFAGLSTGEMMDELVKRGITANYTLDDLKRQKNRQKFSEER